MKAVVSSFRLTAFAVSLLLLFPRIVYSQQTFPFTLGESYYRSEITKVLGKPATFGFNYTSADDDLSIIMRYKSVVINQYYSNLNLKWEAVDNGGHRPIVDYDSPRMKEQRAPLIGIILVDGTYKILEDKIPGGVYYGISRTALKTIQGRHVDDRSGPNKNHYRIFFDDGSILLMYYNAWDRIIFIEYISPKCAIFDWPELDPFTPADEKDKTVSSFHGYDELNNISFPANPVSTFSSLDENNLRDNIANRYDSSDVPLSSLLVFDNQTQMLHNGFKYVQTPFQQDKEQRILAVLHKSRDDFDFQEATEVRRYHIQYCNGAKFDEYIVAMFAKKEFESSHPEYSFLDNANFSGLAFFEDLKGEIYWARLYDNGQIFNGQILKRNERVAPGAWFLYVTIFKEKTNNITMKVNIDNMEIIGTYCIVERSN